MIGIGTQPSVLRYPLSNIAPYAQICGLPSYVRSHCRLESDCSSMQVVFLGSLDLDGRDLTHAQRPATRHIDRAVDLRRVALAAALGNGRPDLVDDHRLARADLALEPALGDRLLARHEAIPAFFFDFARDGRGKVVGHSALHRLIAEAADAIEFGLVEPFEQEVEVRRSEERRVG